MLVLVDILLAALLVVGVIARIERIVFIEKKKMPMESPLLKMVRLQSAVSLPSPLRELLEANRKQKQMMDRIVAINRRQR